MLFKLFIAVVPACLGICAEPLLPAGSKAPDWSLRDVKDVTYDSARFARRTLLIVGGDKSSKQENELWVDRTMETCGASLAIVGVADVSSAPRFFRSRLKSQFQESESSRASGRMGVPLLLDWDGSVAGSFHFAQKVPNVFLVGPDGLLRFAAAGRLTEKLLTNLCGAVITGSPEK